MTKFIDSATTVNLNTAASLFDENATNNDITWSFNADKKLAFADNTTLTFSLQPEAGFGFDQGARSKVSLAAKF